MNMNAPETEEAFLQKAREALRASTAALPAEVLARLRESRRLAVEASARPDPAWRRHGWGLPAGALAAVFVAVLGGVLWLNGGGQPAPVNSFAAGASEDMPIVLTNDSLDMYADMDFYQWMESQDQPAAGQDDPEDSDDDEDDDTGVGG